MRRPVHRDHRNSDRDVGGSMSAFLQTVGARPSMEIGNPNPVCGHEMERSVGAASLNQVASVVVCPNLPGNLFLLRHGHTGRRLSPVLTGRSWCNMRRGLFHLAASVGGLDPGDSVESIARSVNQAFKKSS